MQSMLKNYLQDTKSQVEKFMANLLSDKAHIFDETNKSLYECTKYSVLNGGRRLRPIMTLAAGELFNIPTKLLLGVATSIELIHCYSLVHDDLPAMDDDDLRRGLPAAHKKFDEATAILTGDALQSLAFEILTDQTYTPAAPETQVQLVKILSTAAGLSGIVLGQIADLTAENNIPTLEQLNNISFYKTVSLFTACMHMAAVIANCSTNDTKTLINYAHAIGMAFQITDDIKDVTSNTKTLGKPQGSDQKNNKATFASIMGITAATNYAKKLKTQALEQLQNIKNAKNSKLELLTHHMIKI